MKKPRRKLLWALVAVFVVCPLSLCGIGYAVFNSVFGRAAGDLPNQLRLARAEGLPLEPRDIRPAHPVPPERNAAPEYRAVWKLIEPEIKRHPTFTPGYQKLMSGEESPSQRAEVAKDLAAMRPALQRLKAATIRPECDFEYAYEQGFDVNFPEMASCKTMAKLMLAQAHLDADRGASEEALGWIAASNRLGRHVGSTPTLISMLVQLAINSLTMREFSHALSTMSAKPSALEAAKKTLQGFGPLADLRHAFGGELVMGRIGVQHTRSLSDVSRFSGEGATQPGVTFPDSVVKGFEAKHIEAWRSVFKALPKDPNEWRVASESLKQVTARIDADHSFANTLNRILFPVFDQAALAVGHQQADRRLAAVSIALLEEHLRAGRYPAALAEKGDLTIDPFDGLPLRYRPYPDGFILYSVDRDGEDNGGARPRNGKKGDLVWRFPWNRP